MGLFRRGNYEPMLRIRVKEWQAIADDLAHALYHVWYTVYGIKEGEDADNHFATDALKAYDALCNPTDHSARWNEALWNEYEKS